MFKKIINTLYSVGAAVVVFGAWGKIEHKDFGDTALTVGLLTEVVLFLVYGFMEWKNEPEIPSTKSKFIQLPDVTNLQEKLDTANKNLERVFKM